jgi:hypothetical protein
MRINSINKFNLLPALVAALAITACKDDYNLPFQPEEQYNLVYMPQAVNGAIIKTLRITDSVQSLVFGANLGGVGFAGNDITVNFSVDNSRIDSFNAVNKTNYAALPDGSYTLSATTAIIPKGAINTEPLTVSFKTNGAGAMNALKTYILPIGITGNKTAVNEALRTAFFVVTAQPDFKDYPNYDRNGWQIIDFSSEEANGEGPNNGRAVFVLDGDHNTFWHSQWQGASPGPPHYMTIDMGTTKILHGLSFIARQNDNSGKPNDVNVQVSIDNTTWTDAGSFSLQNNREAQPQFLPNGFKQARYFKVIINSAHNAGFSHLAELNAF